MTMFQIRSLCCFIFIFSLIITFQVESVQAQNIESADTLLHKAKAFEQFDYYQEAFNHYDKSLEVDPSNKEAQKGKDDAWNQMQKHRETITEVDSKISENKETTNDLLRKANAHIALKEYNESLEICSNVLDTESDDFQAFNCKQTSLAELRQYKEILKMYEFYPNLASSSVMVSPFFSLKQFALYHLGEHDQLLDDINIQLDFANDNRKQAWLLLKGMVLEKMGKTSESNQYFQNYLFQSYDRSTSMDIVKGSTFFLIKDYKKAIEYLEKVPKDHNNAAMMKVIAYYELEQSSPSSKLTSNLEKTAKEGKEAVSSVTGGGCLIATATYGSELSTQVQQLRELRDNKLLQTESGIIFMESFNSFYYSFSPYIADYERENPVFKESVKLFITPMIASLSILNHVDMDSESEVLGYGISLIILNLGMYMGIPAFAIISLKKRL